MSNLGVNMFGDGWGSDSNRGHRNRYNYDGVGTNVRVSSNRDPVERPTMPMVTPW